MSKIPTISAMQAKAFIAAKKPLADFHVAGDLDLSGMDLKGVSFPKSVGGTLTILDSDLNGVTLPQFVGRDLRISVARISNVILPAVGRSLLLEACIVRDVAFPEVVPGLMYLCGTDLREAVLPAKVGLMFDVIQCNLDGATLPKKIGSWFRLRIVNLSFRSIALPECREIFMDEVLLAGSTFPTSFMGKLYIRSCALHLCRLPEQIGSLKLKDVNLLEVNLPANFEGTLDLSDCRLDGATLPDTITGKLKLGGCALPAISMPKIVSEAIVHDRGPKAMPTQVYYTT